VVSATTRNALERRNDAMRAVYQACSESKGARIPGDVSAMPLNEAVEVLLSDERPDGYLIQLRALVRLVRAKVHQRHPYGDVVQRMLGQLDLPDLTEIQDRPQGSGAERESAIFRALEEPYRAFRRLPAERPLDLERTTPTTFVKYSPSSLISRVEGWVEVMGKPANFESLINPLCWASNPDSQFKHSYAADLQRWDGDLDGDPPENETPGDSFVLFEDVEFRSGDATQSAFRNLLKIDRETDCGSRARYRLFQSLTSQVGLVSRRGGIDVDSGFFQAVPVVGKPGWTRIEVVKKLRYTDWTPRDTGPPGPWDYGQTMNYLAPSLLGMWIEAVLTEVANAAGSA
jgi:hypothetical protein